MADYEAVIGLEVHAQLATRTKLFCACSNHFGDEPNQNVCPVCSGMPGVLPVLNGVAVEYAVRMALATGCTVNPSSLFARKNYFYPDLPKGYQISQYENPLAEHGVVEIEVEGVRKRIGITRIHMEDDAGKSIHSPADNASFVDLNRSGTPLIEIVSDPDMRSPEEAAAYLKALHSILLYLGICDGNMEEGSFRCDANVSIRPRGQEAFGTRAELKNMNSFRNVQRGIAYEIRRQIDLVEDGEAVVQETRLFDAAKGVTLPMRGKEEAHDYRYFPDPDLLPLTLDPAWIEELRACLPELPEARRQRFVHDFGLPEYDAGVLTADRGLAEYFEAMVRSYPEPKKISNWVMTELMRELNAAAIPVSACTLSPAASASIVKMVDEGAISGNIGKKVLIEVFSTGEDPVAYVKAKGLVQISDASSLDGAVAEVLAAHPGECERYRAGEKKLTGFFVGQVMKKTKGQANPKLVAELLAKHLDG